MFFGSEDIKSTLLKVRGISKRDLERLLKDASVENDMWIVPLEKTDERSVWRLTYSDWCVILVVVREDYVLFRSTYYCHKKIKDYFVENLEGVEVIEQDVKIAMALKEEDRELMSPF